MEWWHYNFACNRTVWVLTINSTCNRCILKTAQAFVQDHGPSVALSITLDKQDLRCYHDNSGVRFTAYYGTLPYSFNWSNGYTGEDLVMWPADFLQWRYGCKRLWSNRKWTLNEPQASAGYRPVRWNFMLWGHTVMATATHGVWEPSVTCGTIRYSDYKDCFNLEAGNYSVKVTDQNGCYMIGSLRSFSRIHWPLNLLRRPTCPGLPTEQSACCERGSPDMISLSNNVFQRSIQISLPVFIHLLYGSEQLHHWNRIYAPGSDTV